MSARFSYLETLECSACDRVYDPDKVQGLCSCGAPLLARYDLAALATDLRGPAFLATRSPDLWRYHELLPVRDPTHIVTLGEGLTPLLPLSRLGAELGLKRLMLKDEGLLPTGSFKARGATVGVSRASELGIGRIAMPTNGNAGAAWAMYAARAGIRAAITMSVDAPPIPRSECFAAGAELYLVEGLIGDAGAALKPLISGVNAPYFDVSTLKEPYRLEGKKTMGLELAEQLCWRLPEVIVYPTGGGVGLIGMHKAFLELRELGWTDGTVPKLVAVQAAGCAPIVRAFQQGARRAEAWSNAHTVAFGITVPNPLGDALILDALYESGGTAISVTDEELLAAQLSLAATEGCFVCPEGAATVAAVSKLRDSGWLDTDSTVVAVNTGTGTKYADLISVDAPVIAAGQTIEPSPFSPNDADAVKAAPADGSTSNSRSRRPGRA
ncbi:threonine synthase [Conexibacter sp. S30A1]|uniref:threonine synthase n=1 Tax=Conexibacter sp. S30A1 TaxID=2937800 RepID=UPI00200FB026|nr:threonine synthase [Conexibacter sp. S30A1]